MNETLAAPELGNRRALSRDDLWPLPYAVAAVLLIAAGTKLLDLPLQLARDSAALAITTITAEWLLALWLISSIRPRPARLTTIGCFALFAAFTLYRAVRGEASCRCFGPVAVNPWYTLALDLTVLTGMVLWRAPVRSSSVRTRAALTGAVAMLTLLVGGALFSQATPATIDQQGTLSRSGGTIILEPQEWLGKAMPVLPYIEGGETLGQGSWLVLFYKHDCEACQAAALALPEKVGADHRRLAIVEIPPFGPADDPGITATAGVTHLRLSADHTWFMATPALLWLDDGVASAVQEQSGPVQRTDGPPTPIPPRVLHFHAPPISCAAGRTHPRYAGTPRITRGAA